MSGHDWEPPAVQMITRERFEMLLLEIRNGANLAVAGVSAEDVDQLATGQTMRAVMSGEAIRADHRAVWYAAEVALGILRPGYMPKREALDDVRRMLAWADGEDDDWPGTD